MKPIKYYLESLLPTPPSQSLPFDLKLDHILKGADRTTYRGLKCSKSPFDYVLYQMLIYQVKPDLIIEIGTLAGGSALYLADLLQLLGHGQVHTIDIKPSSQPLAQLNSRIKTFNHGWQNYPLPSRLRFPKILVIDDGSHIYEDVLGTLHQFSPLIATGSYFIVEDGIIAKMTVPQKYHGGPLRAINQFLTEDPSFRPDLFYGHFFGPNVTFNLRGYLRKIASSP